MLPSLKFYILGVLLFVRGFRRASSLSLLAPRSRRRVRVVVVRSFGRQKGQPWPFLHLDASEECAAFFSNPFLRHSAPFNGVISLEEAIRRLSFLRAAHIPAAIHVHIRTYSFLRDRRNLPSPTARRAPLINNYSSTCRIYDYARREYDSRCGFIGPGPSSSVLRPTHRTHDAHCSIAPRRPILFRPSISSDLAYLQNKAAIYNYS